MAAVISFRMPSSISWGKSMKKSLSNTKGSPLKVMPSSSMEMTPEPSRLPQVSKSFMASWASTPSRVNSTQEE